MYTNKCIKCGKEFETKNPKRVICPDCLYPDKAASAGSNDGGTPTQTGVEYPRSYSFGNDDAPQRYNKKPYNKDQRHSNSQGGYRQDNRRPRHKGKDRAALIKGALIKAVLTKNVPRKNPKHFL